MNCQQIEDRGLLRRFLDGQLEGAERAELKGHVASCPACQGELQLAASLMLQEPAPRLGPVRAAEPIQPSIAARISAWLFPNGVRLWQPALAFAAVLIVASPMLRSLMSPSADDTSGPWRGVGEVATLEQQLSSALDALNKGEARQAFEMLDSRKVSWDQGSPAAVFTAYRARAHAAAELGWADAALQDLHRAQSFAELDPQRMACVEQDLRALRGEGGFCPLPATADLR